MSAENIGIIDIHSKGDYPSCALSNFAGYEFCVDGVKCSSMEGFLQSLKFRNTAKQRQVCLLVGIEAKNASRRGFSQLRWRVTHNLYWQGRRMSRYSDEYQQLLDRAYSELAQNEEFVNALKSSCGNALVHSIGKTNTKETILTEYEFVSRLEILREQLVSE